MTIPSPRSLRRFVVALTLLASAAIPTGSTAAADGSWTTGWPDGQPSNAITVLSTDPSDPSIAYASTSAGLYRTGNQGASWATTINAIGNLTALAVAPSAPSTLYTFAVQAGVFLSDDRGASWTTLGDIPPPLRNVTALALAASGKVLYAGTKAGVWQFSVPAIAPPAVDVRFADYYQRHDGPRVLGNPITGLVIVNGYPAQYFEKGRIEDHSAETADPNWRFMDGLLVDELHQRQANVPVGGNVSSITYADVDRTAAPRFRLVPPPGLRGGVFRDPDGSVFVPFTADLTPAPGHDVAPRFWDFINRQDLFPGGWLHDVGLPIAEPMTAVVDKGPIAGRTIVIQAFQRTVLTDDPLNPPDWQIERANVGSDYLQIVPVR